MTKLPEFTYKDLIKKLRIAGFIFDRQAKGSHEIWFNPKNRLRTTIPNHSKPISKGTLRAIINQIGLTAEEFLNL
jgi:predicted RNA binding protein YcfA (HicA-like mRNA interferase family)